MLIQIPEVLTAQQVEHARRMLNAAEWVDGGQLPEDHPTAREVGDMILVALQGHPLFVSASLPLRVLPPSFNRYDAGQSFGNRFDRAIRPIAGTPLRIRADLSATLFLTEPGDYEGGELMIEDTYGGHAVKLPAGHLALHPSSSLYHLRPITRGGRLSSSFSVQSIVRDDGARTILFDLDNAIQRLGIDVPEHPSMVPLTAVYHNLVRRWAEL